MASETDFYAVVRTYVEKYRISVAPLQPNSKIASQSWGEWQKRLPVVDEYRQWDARSNIAVLTGELSGLVVVDCESRADAEWFWNTKAKTRTVVKTRRGYHLYFRHPGVPVRNGVKVKDDEGNPRYDIRGDGGYVVAPFSKVDGTQYEFQWQCWMRKPAELPVFDVEWLPKWENGNGSADRKISDGAAYIEKIRAISGSGGHADTWRAVNRLKDSGMSSLEALAVLTEWNKTNAEPPWSAGELLHKVRDCYERKN